ncbi:MAG TPA: DUF2285 domain-containing protein [Xanthobacteraceae bacterium]|jgi:hypothetical protein
MQSSPPDLPISDVVPADRNLTRYDQEHLVTYLRLLDADAEGADWQEVAKIVLRIDPKREPDQAKRAPSSSTPCKPGCEGHRVEATRLDLPLRPIEALG